MFGPYTHLFLLAVFALLPLVLLWLKFWKTLVKKTRVVLGVVAGSVLFGWVWDLVAISNGVWGFSKIIGIWFLGVPLEEWLLYVLAAAAISSLTIIEVGKRG